MPPAAIAFLGGAVYEASAVAWVHYSETLAPWRAAMFSGLCAWALVSGIGESVKDPAIAPWFVAGYSVGTFFAVKWNGRRI